jgi:DeoR family fructose operon transcriptional repressor
LNKKNAYSVTFQNRKRHILHWLDAHGEASVHELAQQTGASEITIRRDLTVLADEGVLVRTHGGAMHPDWTAPAVAFGRKAGNQAAQKALIARLAVADVQEGEVLFLDCGSTVFHLCPLLRERRVRVVTNSLPVVGALLGSRVQVNLAGGEVDPRREAVHGPVAEEHLARYRADRAFVGVDGLSLERGLTAHSEHEASITRAMARHAARTYLLCDASKIGQDRYYQFAPLSMVQVLVTDAPRAAVAGFAAAGLEVRCPDEAAAPS